MARNDAVSAVTGEIFREGWSKVRGSMQGLGQKRPQMVRAAKGHRSAVFKPVRSGGCQTKKELTNQLEYLTTKSSHIVDGRGVLDGKRQLNADEIKSVVDRFSGRWSEGFRPKMGHTTHLLMSYPKGTTGEDVRDISAAVSERFFANDERNFDYIIAIHEDRDHPHAHIVINRKSQEGEFFYLGRDHHFNYDDFRTAMVEEAEKVGVRLEATKRVDRGDTTYAPRTKEIYEAKKEDREPVQRERVGRDLDRALAEIATTAKAYRSLAAEANDENREDIANALFRAGEILAAGGKLEQDGEIYMANQESFDDLRGRFSDRAERVEQFVRDAPDSMKALYEKQLDQIYRNVAHMQPMGVRSQTLNDAPSDTGVYSETNINKEGVGAMKEPETRAQIETALRGTGISSSAIIARVEQGASNASLEQRWIADDLSKIAKEDGLNLERQEDLAVAAQKLDAAHVRLGETLERAEVLKDDGIVYSDDQERPSDEEFASMMENAADEDYRNDIADQLRAEAGAERAEIEGIAKAGREEAVSDAFKQNMKSMERAGMPASVIGGYTVEMTDRAEQRIDENPELIGMSRQDRREFEALENDLTQTGEFLDGSENDAKLQQDREVQFEAFAAKSSAHAQLASRAWDKLGTDLDKPNGFVEGQRDTVAVRNDNETTAQQIDRGVIEQYENPTSDYARFERLGFERNQAGGKIDGVAMGEAFTTLAKDRNDGAMSLEERQRTDEYLKDTADQYGDMMRSALLRQDTREFREHEHEDHEAYSEASQKFELERLREFDNAVRPYRTDQVESAEMRRVIEHEKVEKIDGPFDQFGGEHTFRDDVERELNDEQLEALKKGDADALSEVIDNRLDRLYAAKAYLQSDEATANSEATREVISEINDEEYDAIRLKQVHANTEKGQTHG
ncbi:relaxase/mobilization nuclease-like protein [Litoreibacter meonggei]|uniref:Relaxase/mobilization nuclease-like protein n=1 Tax=Litoreibacter meonggei TaxID=1049199 RepID=A0A497V200_9RHOB|nr:relaxase/mobilization nuclease domain-containing protein [Litoreibacter meonggei]RLJ36227.1 relaxase/mobilization nuclease-like protein [Litoreibacter meonggei]